MKIGITGYQSVKKAIIDAEPSQIIGITGDNNVGKSAIERAIRAFIVNYSSTKDFINVDLNKVKVIVRTNEGTQYGWEKTESDATYSKDKEVKRKLNRAPLDDVYPGSGFLVEKEGSEIWVPSIVSENEEIFPFNLSPASAFKIFSRFVSSPKIGVIIKELRDIIKEDKGQLEVVRTKINVMETELSLLTTRLASAPDEELLKSWKERLIKVNEIKLKIVNWSKEVKIQEGVKVLEEELGRIEKFLQYKEVFAKVEKVVDIIKRWNLMRKQELDLSLQYKASVKELEILKGVKAEFKFCPLCEREF